MVNEISEIPQVAFEVKRSLGSLKSETAVAKHSLTIEGHRTSISLETIFWDRLKELASQDNRSLASLVSEIDSTRGEANLSSAIRVFVLRRALAN